MPQRVDARIPSRGLQNGAPEGNEGRDVNRIGDRKQKVEHRMQQTLEENGIKARGKNRWAARLGCVTGPRALGVTANTPIKKNVDTPLDWTEPLERVEKHPHTQRDTKHTDKHEETTAVLAQDRQRSTSWAGGRETKRKRRVCHQPEPSTWSPTKPEEPFMTKGTAADALCNLAAGIPRQVPGHAPQGARFRGNPSNDSPLPHAFKTSGHKVAPREATREAVSWKVRLRFSTKSKTPATDDRAEVMLERRSKMEKSQASVILDTSRGTQTSAGRRPPPQTGGKGSTTWSSSEPVPGFSNSGESEVNSATAKQTRLRIALWRRTLSPPPQLERE